MILKMIIRINSLLIKNNYQNIIKKDIQFNSRFYKYIFFFFFFIKKKKKKHTGYKKKKKKKKNPSKKNMGKMGWFVYSFLCAQ